MTAVATPHAHTWRCNEGAIVASVLGAALAVDAAWIAARHDSASIVGGRHRVASLAVVGFFACHLLASGPWDPLAYAGRALRKHLARALAEGIEGEGC